MGEQPLVADFVAKVENPKTPNISRKSIPRHRCRCEASWRRYEGPWSFWRETIWSLTSRGARRISGSENFGSPPQKYFCNKICTKRTCHLMQSMSVRRGRPEVTGPRPNRYY